MKSYLLILLFHNGCQFNRNLEIPERSRRNQVIQCDPATKLSSIESLPLDAQIEATLKLVPEKKNVQDIAAALSILQNAFPKILEQEELAVRDTQKGLMCKHGSARLPAR